MRPLLLFVAIATACLPPTSAWAGASATKARVTRYAEHMMGEFYRPDAPGAAILIARGDEILYRGARGLADVKTGTPLTPDSVFRIGSVSKQFAAAGLLKLVEAGKLSLDDPLSKYVPHFPNGEHITVLELLNHTSGVKDYTHIAAWRDGPIEKDLSTAQLIATFKDAKPDFAPGEDWAYDNSGYALVGAVIEAVSGQPWHAYLRSALFEPLGLTHTGYGADPQFAAQQVHGYSLEDGKVVPAKVISMTIPNAAGALVSTVGDLLKWNRALHEGRVLKSETYRRMITPVGKAVEAKYGLGIELATVQGRLMLDHSGGIFGFESMLEYVPGPDISVVVLQNNDSNDDDKGPDMIARKLAAAALGEPYPESTAIAVGATTLKRFEGVYRIDDHNARVLRVVDGKLTAQRTGGQRSILLPIAADEFLYGNGLDRFTVQRDAAGTVTGMRFFANGEPPGVLVARTREPLPSERQEVPLSRAALDRVLGTYAAGEMKMKVFMDGNRLKAQMGRQTPVEIFAESPDRFFMTVVDAALAFAAGKGSPSAVTLSQGGHTMVFRRLL
ncbi:serine hydrolase domain-containing protein [Rhodanobacter umsongensis]|uniref:Serine hydrolase domain-containing protein n=1 Tax=Rhodanobacter umsongensis TaxID=633153 RepID=A0ABW0JKJ1_9GAMM